MKKIEDILNIGKKEVISFVGAGGKTTTIQRLSMKLRKIGKVLSTTSTAIMKPSKDDYDVIYIGEIPYEYLPDMKSITVYGEYEQNGKLGSKDISKIDELIARGIFDYILIEADGANRRPIKAPNTYEPMISEFTTTTIGVLGVECLNRRIGEIAHRPELFSKIVHKDIYDFIDYEDILKLTLHKEGLFKNSEGRKILFLNKVEDSQLDIIGKIEERLVNFGIDVAIGRMGTHLVQGGEIFYKL
ncbi:MAG: selenium cofactor biosynthesis protein YqeC [Tissierellaceae bacterium]